MNDVLITRDQLCAKLLISDTTRQRLEKTDPQFPAKIRVSPRRVAYRLSDLERYIAGRTVMVAADATPVRLA